MKQLILQHIKNINSVQQQKTHGENQNLDTSTHAGGLYDNCKHSSARSDPGTRLPALQETLDDLSINDA